jgi:WD40 repeat protein
LTAMAAAPSRVALRAHIHIQGAHIKGVTHSDDGVTAVVVGDRDGHGLVCVINMATWTVLAPLEFERNATCVTRLAPSQDDGSRFVVGFGDGCLRVFRQDQTNKALVAIAGASPQNGHNQSVTSMALNRTGRMLATTAIVTKTVGVWDVALETSEITPAKWGNHVSLHPHPQTVNVVAWSPTEEYLMVTACRDGIVRLFDTRVSEVPVRGNVTTAATCVAFAPDGATIAAGYNNGQVVRWDVREPHIMNMIGTPIKAHQGTVKCVQYSPCGRVLATGGNDKMVKLWDATGPELVALEDDAMLQGHTAPVYGLEFNPEDPSQLLSCSSDGTVRVWNVPECALGLPLEGPEPPESPPRAAAAAAAAAATSGDDASSGLGKRRREADDGNDDDDDGGAAGGSGGGIAAARARRAPAPALFGSLVRLTAALSLTVNRDPNTKQITGFTAPGSKVTISPHDARQVVHDMVVAKHGSAKACSLFQ